VDARYSLPATVERRDERSTPVVGENHVSNASTVDK
jgi:hypothetical protein